MPHDRRCSQIISRASTDTANEPSSKMLTHTQPYLVPYPRDTGGNASSCCQCEWSRCCRRRRTARGCSWWRLRPPRSRRQSGTGKCVFRSFAVRLWSCSGESQETIVTRDTKLIGVIIGVATCDVHTLNFCSSVFDIVSAFAMIGMIFTFESSFFMHTRSIDFKLKVMIRM